MGVSDSSMGQRVTVASSSQACTLFTMEFHRSLAFALLLEQILFGLWGLALGFRRRPLGSTFFTVILIDEILLIIQALIGLFLFLSGHTLKSDIHFLYGGLLVGLLPVVWVWGNRRPERAGLWLGFTLLFMAGLIVRTYFTG